jgi:5-formyltetrahydrofolate cyclo-ligase
MNKDEARKVYKDLRKLIASEQLDVLSKDIFENILKIIEQNQPKTIHVFLPIKSFQEPNTYLLIDLLKTKNITIGIPKVNTSDNSMICVAFYSQINIADSPWNIPEPVGADLEIISPKEIDLMVLPMLICDSRGNRVGYGKGFYDKYIQQCRPEMLKVGICFFEPIGTIVDVTNHDQQLDYCVTPTKVYNFRS